MFAAVSAHWTGNVDPVAFTIFGRDIAWYGIIITCAMIIGLIAATIRSKKVGLTFDDLVEVFICELNIKSRNQFRNFLVNSLRVNPKAQIFTNKLCQEL